MTELANLQRSDERVRQIAGLYEIEKARANRLHLALKELVRQVSSNTGGSMADLITALNNAKNLVNL